MTLSKKALIISVCIIICIISIAVILSQPKRMIDPAPNYCSNKGGICKPECNLGEQVIDEECTENRICCNITK
jgi:hypothetical protein